MRDIGETFRVSLDGTRIYSSWRFDPGLTSIPDPPSLPRLHLFATRSICTLADTQARREHRKSHDATPEDACPTCSDYSTRGAALLAELEEMDKTLREMEDSVVEDVRAFRAARRREKREKEREKKREMERKEVRKSAAGAV